MGLPATLKSCFIPVCAKPIHYIASAVPVDPHPAVVLVHGCGMSHRYMVPYANLLAHHFQVFAVDQPGFGLSYKPWHVFNMPELADWLVVWMDMMRLDRAVLYGNSVGCQVVANCAVRHPGRVLRAVLQGPTVDPSAPTVWAQWRRWWRNRRQERGTEKGPIATRDYWDSGIRRIAKTFRHAIADHTERLYPHMRCPTLVVRGELDPIAPQRWVEEIVRLLPNGRLIVLPGVPHTANLEAPEDLMRVTRPFYEAERATLAQEVMPMSVPEVGAGLSRR